MTTPCDPLLPVPDFLLRQRNAPDPAWLRRPYAPLPFLVGALVGLVGCGAFVFADGYHIVSLAVAALGAACMLDAA